MRYDQAPPDLQQAAERVREVSHSEELTAAVQARIVANRNLNHSESSLFKLLGHFNTDHTTPGLQRNPIEHVSAKQTKVTIDISNRDPERQPHRAAVTFSDPDAIPGIGALHFVAVDEIDVGREPRE